MAVGRKAPSEPTLRGFGERFGGTVYLPGDPGYDEARAVWNGMIDRRPAVVARCRGVADVIEAVRFAREEDLTVAVRGGGHNVAGTAVCDDGIVIDLSEMRSVRVDPAARTARAEAGATWADLDRETQALGLAAPGGVISETGIAGLTLGGGLGHLRRKYGLSCDNLVSADLVTADGEFLTANEEEHSDLFWALRGGGGNFGVVTSFEYRLHPVGPEVMGLLVFQPADRAADLLRGFREFAASAPDEASVVAFYAWIPAEEPFPSKAWGRPTVAFLGTYAGTVEAGERALAPLRELDAPLADFSGPMPYVELQSLLDEDYPDGRLYYWKSLNLSALDDEVIERLLEHAAACPSPLSTLDVWHNGGAIARVDPDATAFAHRDAEFLLGMEANWEDPDERDANVEWVRDTIADLRRHSPGGLYVNFPGFGEEGEALVREVYGRHYDRLVEVKNRYDPTNLFDQNQNIRPTG